MHLRTKRCLQPFALLLAVIALSVAAHAVQNGKNQVHPAVDRRGTFQTGTGISLFQPSKAAKARRLELVTGKYSLDRQPRRIGRRRGGLRHGRDLAKQQRRKRDEI